MHANQQQRLPSFKIACGAVLGILCLGLAMGCGTGAPSESEAEALLSREAERCGEGLLELQTFRKTNAQTGEIAGVKLYHMYFAAEVEFLTDAFAPKEYKPWCADEVSPYRRGLGDFVESGTIRSLSGRMTFAHSENGWLLDSLGDGAIVEERLSEAALRAAEARQIQEKTAAEVRRNQGEAERVALEKRRTLFHGAWRLLRYAPAGEAWREPDWGEEVMEILPGGRYEVNGQPGSWSFHSDNGSLTLTIGTSRNTATIDGDTLELTDRRGGRYRYVRIRD